MVLSSINNIPSHPNFSNKENAMKNSNKKMSKPVVTGTSSSSNDNEQENRGDIQNYSTRLPLSSSSSNIKKHQTKNASEILLSSLLLPSLSTASKRNDSDFKKQRILLEYKQLKENAPSGVYIVPALLQPPSPSTSKPDKIDIMNIFYGVIFVRRGMYRNAIYKFQIILPANYNSPQSFPKVYFFSEVMHPYVSANPIPPNGDNAPKYELNLQMAHLIGRAWNPKKHALISVALCIKKLFFLTQFEEPLLSSEYYPYIKTKKITNNQSKKGSRQDRGYLSLLSSSSREQPEQQVEVQEEDIYGNYNAWLLWKIDFKGFEKLVHESTDESQRHVKDDKYSSMKFASYDERKHEVLRDLLTGKIHEKEQILTTQIKPQGTSSNKHLVLNQAEILELVSKADSLDYGEKHQEPISKPMSMKPSSITNEQLHQSDQGHQVRKQLSFSSASTSSIFSRLNLPQKTDLDNLNQWFTLGFNK